MSLVDFIIERSNGAWRQVKGPMTMIFAGLERMACGHCLDRRGI